MPPRQPETASVSLGKMAKLETMVTRYRGSNDIEQIDSRDIVPGDVVVIPIGTDIAPTPPTDIAEVASSAVYHDNLKIHARVLASLGIEGHWPAKLAT